VGGDGGKGGGKCPDEVGHTGGDGGEGGDASAEADIHVWAQAAFARAEGGNGGDGGDGIHSSGVPGDLGLGNAYAYTNSHKTEVDGKNGNEGDICPPLTIPPGKGEFKINWSSGNLFTIGAIYFVFNNGTSQTSMLSSSNGTFTQTGTGGTAGSFSGNGTWSYDSNSSLLTITFLSYTLNGDTITPGPGDTWATLFGTLTNGSGTLEDADKTWSMDISPSS